MLDWRVLAFAAGLAIFTGLLFGVVPAWLAGRMQPSADALRAQGAPQNSGAGRMRMALIAMQAAFTVALLAGALTLGRGFLKLLGTDLGFRTDHVVTLNVSLAGTRWDTDTCCGAYYAAALERLRAVPGVESAGLAGYLPLIRYSIFMGGATELDSGQKGPVASLNSASPGYFQTMRAELVAGRDFTPADGAPGARVAIVTEDVARAFGPGPIAGRRLKFWGWSTVVGVVRSQRGNGPARGISGEVYLPVEHSTTGFATFVARVRGKTEAYLPVCRDAVRQVDPSVPVYDVKTLDRRLADNLARPRFYATAILFFGGFALLLAIIGVYGVAAYGVAQRTHEIGVRIAVGAAPSALRLAILRLNLAPMVLGMAVGTAAAVGMGRYLQHLAGAAEPAGAGTGAAGAAIL
ncbi:MAG: ABC transporter permease, partial [Acidobacteriia bacterium]|nr:ABC transporter permease [Terriglobia bacterium]